MAPQGPLSQAWVSAEARRRSSACARRLALACVPLVVSACATVGQPSTGASTAATVSPSLQASEPASQAPSTDLSLAMVYVNEAQGWSIGVPTGWSVVAQNATGAALSGGEAFAEILLASATGLTLEQREAQRVTEISTWPGVDEIESDIVSLPAGEAIRLIFETGVAPDPPARFIFYVFEEGDTQFVMSVRGPKDIDDLPAVAEGLAESFAVLD